MAIDMSDVVAGRPADRGRMTVAGFAGQELRKMVLDGRLTPGERLNEVAISQELEISRGPLREAIQRLTSEGLLVAVPHRGAFVRTMTEDELRELYELRIAVETFAVRLVVERTPVEQLQSLDQVLEDARGALEEGAHYPSELDVHDLLVQLAGNTALLRTMRDTHARIHVARARSAYDPERARKAHQEHEDIVAAIRRGEAAGAATLLESHLRQSLDNAVNLI